MIRWGDKAKLNFENLNLMPLLCTIIKTNTNSLLIMSKFLHFSTLLIFWQFVNAGCNQFIGTTQRRRDCADI